ncbi:HsdM family class I SAM-dependent methyltransferase [Butyrivibrio sp. XBB1001]|uniref:HsdM family class I SAM-dependent methyltransferase n=1 Tax=Butyrivibrio sp. XBB1001 TaxID=1280682 RepID=UPI0003F69785|nr:N-6 DNA methylase [Butyrivibrio sp. XBB1001]
MATGKSDASEETTKGLTSDRLKEIEGYPTAQNVTVDGITWFKEDSYKGTSYDWLKRVFRYASKKQTMKSKGTPDYIVTLDNSDVIVIIECKGSMDDHSMFDDVTRYLAYGYGNADETEKYAINGALWYASFLKDDYDVIAVGISGQSEAEAKVTSFVWPKGREIGEIALLEDGHLDDSLVSIHQYKKDADTVLGRFAETEEDIRKELRRYTLACANFLRANGIEDNSKAGFVSAVILGLTNHESRLYKDTKAAIDKKRSSKAKKMIGDSISKDSVKMLKYSLYGEGNDEYADDYVKGIWDIDEIPKGKRVSLKKFYDALLAKDELIMAPKGKGKYFPDGETVLSSCIFSLYENVVEVVEKYSGIDVMGEFYTTFLRFTKGNAKEKGIVLTPKHITDFFCDIAEYYSDTKFDENTKIVDICCGTGAFLIAALNRIKKNIQADKQSEDKKLERYGVAQRNSLIGVEKDASMYALAYANMRFHGDGKSNLFNCSSLLIDSYAPADDSGKTFVGNKKIPLNEALAEFGDIDIGMINPPYSLDKKENNTEQEYEIVKEINELKDKNKKLAKQIKDITKKAKKGFEKEVEDLNKQIQSNKDIIKSKELAFDKSGLREVAIQKGQSELDFVASMLHYLKKGGIGIAIVPMSCAGNSGTKLRKEILKYHTLLACSSMPGQLFFDSHVGTNTCIMVFKAHVPHDKTKAVFFARWLDDGFKVIPHNGRKDTGKWDAIRAEWIDEMDGVASPNPKKFLKVKIDNGDEALAEAYIETDYSQLTEDDFEMTLKKYALYRYMEDQGMLEE